MDYRKPYLLSFSGQQIVRLPDGRLQLITLAQQAGQAAVTSAQSSASSSPLTAIRAVQSQPGTTASQTIIVSSSTPSVTIPSAATSPASTSQTKVIIPSQAISSLPGLSSGAVAIVSSPQGAQGTINVISSGGQTVAKIISPTAIKGKISYMRKH